MISSPMLDKVILIFKPKNRQLSVESHLNLPFTRQSFLTKLVSQVPADQVIVKQQPSNRQLTLLLVSRRRFDLRLRVNLFVVIYSSVPEDTGLQQLR